MPLIKLNRINKGGSIYVNSDDIRFMEIEFRTTTVHMSSNLLFSVEETLDQINELIEASIAKRIARGINESSLVKKPEVPGQPGQPPAA